MVDIDRNRMQYMNINRVRQDSALADAWLKQQSEKNTAFQNREFLNKAQQKQSLKQSQSTAKSGQINRVQAIQAIDAVDGIEGVSGVDAVSAIETNPVISFKDAGRFDMKQDIADFVKPQNVPAEYIRKDVLSKTAERVLLHLQASGASENLIKRATMLLEEEHNVKSVTDAYKNALVFA